MGMEVKVCPGHSEKIMVVSFENLDSAPDKLIHLSQYT